MREGNTLTCKQDNWVRKGLMGVIKIVGEDEECHKIGMHRLLKTENRNLEQTSRQRLYQIPIFGSQVAFHASSKN